MRRTLAFFVDLWILVGSGALLLFVLGEVSNRQLLERSTGFYLFLLPFSLACIEAFRAATSPGKYLFGLTVIDVETGKSPTPLKLFLRAAILFDSAYLTTQLIPAALDILGLRSPFQASFVVVLLVGSAVPFIATKGSQLLHDSLTGTAVIPTDGKATVATFTRTRTVGLLLVGSALAFFFSLPGSQHFARGTEEDTQLDPLLRILEAEKTTVAALQTPLLGEGVPFFDLFALDHRAVQTKHANPQHIDAELRKAYPSAAISVSGGVSEYAVAVTPYGFISSRFQWQTAHNAVKQLADRDEANASLIYFVYHVRWLGFIHLDIVTSWVGTAARQGGQTIVLIKPFEPGSNLRFGVVAAPRSATKNIR